MPHPHSSRSSSTLLRLVSALVVVAATMVAIPHAVPSTGAQSVCPNGTILGTATWGTSGTLVWENSVANQTSGASQTYPNVAGGVDLTVSYLDPANVNEDLDNPYLNYVAGDSWDAPVYTRTNGVYGSDYFTIVMNSLTSDQVVDWSFTFTKPVFVPDFSVSDIDWAGYGYNSSGIGTPHESFQDEVVLAGQRGGNTIAFTATGGSGITNLGGGRLVAGPYTPGVNGNVGPTDAAGTAQLSPVGPITSFNMQYSNGPDDAAADVLDGSPVAPIPPNSPGVSNNHAVAINGFTVCAGNLRFGDRVWADVDGDGVQDPGEPGIPGVTVSISDPDGNLIETQITDSSGAYEFEQFPGFTWVVSIDTPAGYTPTHDRDGGDYTSTAIDPTTDEFDIDFGLQPDPGQITGTVLSDRNNNGTLDAAASDVPIPGVTVSLDGTDLGGTAITASTTTAADGSYAFSNIPAGSYVVTETQPAVGFIDGIDTPGTNATTGGNDRHDVIIGLFESSVGNDFAEVPNSSLAGSVFEDDDNDGSRDGGESGIGAVDVTLVGADVFGNPVSLSASTQPDGSYRFPLLISGTYDLIESQPVGFADGQESAGSSGGTVGADRIDGIPLGFDVDAVDYDFGELPPSSIGGSVSDDGANPIPGVAIGLSGLDDLGASVAATVSTAADGTYVFADLRPGTYTVTETQPAEYGDGPDRVGTVEGVSEGTLGNDVISAIDLGVGQDGVDYDFTETRGSIGGTVVDDAGTGIVGVAITLTGTDAFGAPVSAATTTGPGGSFRFSDLVAGTYTLVESQPAAYGDGSESVGSAGGTTSVDDTISAIALAGGQDATGYEFAETRSSISGQVFVDPENDGSFGATGVPESGVAVRLTGVDILGNPVDRVTATAADGSYRFDGLLAGTYAVDETQPAGLIDGIDSAGSEGGDVSINDRISGIALGPGVDGTGYDFAELPPAGISGSVTDDTGAPISGVTISLSGTTVFGSTITQTTTTAADGTYSFFALPPGTYRIDETQPVGYGDGPDVAGTVNGTVTGTTGNDQITDIALGPDDVGVAYDFTETLGSLAGQVVDDGGNGIAGVLVTLTGSDATGGTVARVTTTASDGSYSFDRLLAGTYALSETQPPAYGDGGETAGTAGGDDSANDVITAIVLPAGTDATGYDFDETRGSIRGRVYEDRNNNGVRNGGEPGIAGVTVSLTGTDVNGSPVSLTTTTSGNGSFRFNRLLAGTYTVSETQPIGYLDGAERAGSGGGDTTVDDEISGIVLAGGAIARPYQFGELAPASITGTVFNDLDESGSLDGGEPGIGGATVSLSGTDDRGTAVTLTTITATDGTYRFAGLRPGAYSVTETQPTGFIDGADRAGTIDGAPVGDTSVNDVISAVILWSGDDAVGYDFGELEGASITGTVVDDGANGIADVEITLTGTDDLGTPTNRSTTTATDGTYTFDALRPGTYTITETQPAAYGDGGETAGTINGTTVGNDTTDDTITNITIGSGDTATGYDFDETRGSLNGTVFGDVNNNGIQDLGEAGIDGTTIRLTGTNVNGATVSGLTTTAADGSYRFNFLLAGTYTIAETQPTGFIDGIDTAGTIDGAPVGDTSVNDTVSSIALPGGADGVGYDFGELEGASITGTVVDDGANGIADVEITLTGTDDLGTPTNRSTTTAGDGTYTFDALRPGTYTITETQPAAYGDGGETAGTINGTTVGDDTTDDTITSITIGSGDTATGYDFDETRGSLNGTVYEDLDGDGSLGSGEPGIDGVVVELTGTDALGAAVSRSITTAGDGSYRFDDLLAGTYTVTETQPVAFQDGQESIGTSGGIPSANDTITAIAFLGGATATGYDFGEVLLGQLSGTVFIDDDNSGSLDSGERGIGGVTITLTGTDDLGTPTNRSTTTAGDGTYTFDALRPGTYTVTEAQPANLLDGADSVGTAGGVATGDQVVGIVVSSGATGTGYDFGELEPAELSGTVVDDLGRPITGVTVTLTGTDDLGATVAESTTTAADGSYSFDLLRPGDYAVTETQPAGFGDGGETAGTVDGTPVGDDTADDTITAIVIGSGDSGVGYDFDERTGTIAGSVFVDADGNTIRTLGDIDLAGVAVSLTGTDANGSAVAASVTTGPDGSYRFDGLLAGIYTLTETQPSGYLDGLDTPGTAGGSADNSLGGDRISAIALDPGGISIGNNFSEVVAASIGGVVVDDGGNGISGVTVTLDGVDLFGTAVVRTAATGSDGSYSFDALHSGTYAIIETQPPAYGDGGETAGTINGTTVGNDTTDDAITDIIIGSGDTATGYDFDETRMSLSGAVVVDLDGDGAADSGEVGIAGVAITLTGVTVDGDPVSATTTTGIDGRYVFNDLLAGTYTLTETQPTDYLDGDEAAGSAGGTVGDDQISGIDLLPGMDAVAYDFGEIEPSSLGGSSRDDLGRPIANVEITLAGTDDRGAAVSSTTTTASDGSYRFDGLRPGTYELTQTQPVAYGDGADSVGSLGGVVVGPSADDRIGSIIVSSGSVGVDYDFVDTTGSLSGSVVQTTSAGDSPIAGVTIHLDGVDVNGLVVSATTTTTTDGTYRFDGLLAGDYTLTETQPAVFADGPERVGTIGGDATINDLISAIVLTPGTSGTGYDFTETGTVLTGRVWLDRTGDDLPDPIDDFDLSGITIELIGGDGSVVASTTTGIDGTYAIGGLLAGSYTVRQTQPDAWGSVTADQLSVTLPVDGLSGIDFGERAGAISGTVFGDDDTNGLDDQATPQPGITVTLTGPDGLIATASTDADGNYRFLGLPAADYVVTMSTPAGTMFTTANVGSDDTIDSDAESSSGRVAVGLSPGATVTDIDAGIVTIEQDLAIEITTTATDLEVGDSAPFTARVTNTGNVPVAGGVSVSIPLPEGTTFVSATGDGWSIAVATDGSVTATRPDTLGPAETVPTITLVVQPTRPGTITVAGEVVSSAGLVETTVVNNVSSVPVTVVVATTSIPNLAYTGSSLLLLLLVAGGLLVTGRTMTLIGASHRREDFED